MNGLLLKNDRNQEGLTVDAQEELVISIILKILFF